MTPPCARCHGAPYTPDLPEGWDRPGATLPHCGAETRWSGEGSTLAPEPGAPESWIRSNFERAREEPRPFRIDLAEAHLRADLRAQARTTSFLAWPWGGSPYRAVAVNTAGMRVRADWEFSDNSLVLGFRELLSVEDLAIDGPLSANAWPQSLRVGNFGQLHFITRTTPSALFVLEPFMVPRPPIGEDMPTGRQWEACEARRAAGGIDAGLENCLVEVVYPNHREDPRLDRILTSFVPAEFLDSDGRLPTNYNLESLFANFLEWRGNHPADPNAPRRDTLALVEQWLSPGSHIDLDIDRLNDFFIPGLLDLGPSRGQIRLSYAGGRRFTGSADNFEIQLDPIAFPASQDGGSSTVELHNAYLSSASAPVTMDGGEIAPGLRFDFNAATDELWVEGNVALHSDLRVPLWGDIELSGDLALRSAWRRQDGEWRPVPGTTHIEWRNGELWEAGGHRPIFTNFEIDASDTFDPLDPFAVDPQGLRVHTQGLWGRAGEIDVDLNLPIPRDLGGGYDFQSLLHELPARLALRFSGQETYQAEMNLSVPLIGENEGHILAGLDVSRGTGEHRRPVIEGAQIQVDLRRASAEEDGVSLDLNASRFSAFGLDLRQLGVRVSLERIRHEEGVIEVRIPAFQIRANPRGNALGLLRGPLNIELRPPPGGAMALSWDGPARRLSLNNLDLHFSLQGIHLAPLQSVAFHRAVNPRIVALGVDGQLQGSLRAYLPVDRNAWRARGSVNLRGDRDGDIYFLDRAGHRVGPALIRDTRWRFSQVDHINWERRYALGRFHLDTLLNFSSLLPPFEAGETAPAYGLRGQELRPYEINGVMPYDNQPWNLSGFRNRIVDYLATLCRRDARCREGIE